MKTITKYFTDSQIANRLLWWGRIRRPPLNVYIMYGVAHGRHRNASAARFVQLSNTDLAFAPRSASKRPELQRPVDGTVC